MDPCEHESINQFLLQLANGSRNIGLKWLTNIWLKFKILSNWCFFVNVLPSAGNQSHDMLEISLMSYYVAVCLFNHSFKYMCNHTSHMLHAWNLSTPTMAQILVSIPTLSILGISSIIFLFKLCPWPPISHSFRRPNLGWDYNPYGLTFLIGLRPLTR